MPEPSAHSYVLVGFASLMRHTKHATNTLFRAKLSKNKKSAGNQRKPVRSQQKVSVGSSKVRVGSTKVTQGSARAVKVTSEC